VLPTTKDCAEHLSLFVDAYANDLAASGGDAGCQCVLIGHDERSGSMSGWLIEANGRVIDGGPIVRELNLSPLTVEVLGSGKREAETKLAAIPPAEPGLRREPLHMIRHWLKGEPAHDVGGSVQIGQVTPAGFELYFDAQRFRAGTSRAGDPLVSMTYRGFDLSSVSRVGDAFVTIRGLS
jgi:hypothetical protein